MDIIDAVWWVQYRRINNGMHDGAKPICPLCFEETCNTVLNNISVGMFFMPGKTNAMCYHHSNVYCAIVEQFKYERWAQVVTASKLC